MQNREELTLLQWLWSLHTSRCSLEARWMLQFTFVKSSTFIYKCSNPVKVNFLMQLQFIRLKMNWLSNNVKLDYHMEQGVLTKLDFVQPFSLNCANTNWTFYSETDGGRKRSCTTLKYLISSSCCNFWSNVQGIRWHTKLKRLYATFWPTSHMLWRSIILCMRDKWMRDSLKDPLYGKMNLITCVLFLFLNQYRKS